MKDMDDEEDRLNFEVGFCAALRSAWGRGADVWRLCVQWKF
jgi:hypothetical protein